MGSAVCHKGTLRVSVCFAAAILTGAATFAQPAPAWRKVGSAAADLQLAGPATGPVAQVWFSPGGGVLYARSASGAVFATADFETWTPATGAAEPPVARAAAAARLPEASVRMVAASSNPNVIFGLGKQLYRSEDGGHSWDNLTAYGRLGPDRLGRRFRNDADFGQRVAGVGLDLEPDAKPRLRVPDGDHFGAGIAGDHGGGALPW